jgi:hypothetical protein
MIEVGKLYRLKCELRAVMSAYRFDENNAIDFSIGETIVSGDIVVPLGMPFAKLFVSKDGNSRHSSRAIKILFKDKVLHILHTSEDAFLDLFERVPYGKEN